MDSTLETTDCRKPLFPSQKLCFGTTACPLGQPMPVEQKESWQGQLQHSQLGPVTHDLVPALPARPDDPFMFIVICKGRGRAGYAWGLLGLSCPGGPPGGVSGSGCIPTGERPWWPVSLAPCWEGTDLSFKPDPSVAFECLALGKWTTKGIVDGRCC